MDYKLGELGLSKLELCMSLVKAVIQFSCGIIIKFGRSSYKTKTLPFYVSALIAHILPLLLQHVDIGRCLVCTSTTSRAGPTARDPTAIYTTENSLIDHIYKHVPKQLQPGRPFQLGFSISR